MCRRDGTQSNPIVRKTELRRELPCSTSEPPAIFSLVPGGPLSDKCYPLGNNFAWLAVGAVPGDDGPREGTSSRVNHDNHTPPANAPSAQSEPHGVALGALPRAGNQCALTLIRPQSSANQWH